MSRATPPAPVTDLPLFHRYLRDHLVPHLWHVEDNGHDAGARGGNLYHFANASLRDRMAACMMPRSERLPAARIRHPDAEELDFAASGGFPACA